jgi:hypothetical protein
LTLLIATAFRPFHHVFKPGYEHRSSEEKYSRASSRFPPVLCALAVSGVRTHFFSSLFCVTSVPLMSHADVSYRAAVCISSDVLLLTAFLLSCPSFLCPPRTHQRALTRYTITCALRYSIPKPQSRQLKKRKRVDARHLEVLNRTYARTAFPSIEESLQLSKDLASVSWH